MTQQAPDVELVNAGAGPDPLSLSELAGRDDVDAIVLLFQRDDYCLQCRSQVQAANDRYAEFTTRNAWVVSVLPETLDTARDWVENYDLMFPVLADPDGVAAEAYDQPTRFGALGEAVDLVGRLPKALILDTREGELEPRYVHEGESTGDRPSMDELLAQVTEITGNEGVDPEEFQRRA
ncbi:peroxiredoxin [Thermoplasmatales archaeon SW_10_69_26]|nr:MAG: peroxiredoxin [Thermoplasmatales archaeon SW_10_69_26]